MDVEVFGNPMTAWASALGIALGLTFAAAILRSIVQHRIAAIARRTSTRVDDAMIHALDGTRLFLLFVIALNVCLQPLLLPPIADRALGVSAMLAFVTQIGIWGTRLLTYSLDRARERAMETDASTATSLTALGFVGRLVLWSVLLLVALDNLGIDVTALVAGLGIGGLAVALAVQNILGDLFASLSILIDKPFVIGDFIVIDDYLGTVEHIGLKTTRIRSLGGEQLVFSNGDLLSSRLRNYKRMRERRVVFQFGVVYQTRPELLERIPQLVREIIEAQAKTRYDRAHFQSFADSALQFEVVYWMLDPDYNGYMDVQQSINLCLVRRFADLGIEFAYPTRTLYMAEPQPSSR